MAKYCTKCGAYLESNVKFCSRCGEKVGEKNIETTNKENNNLNNNQPKSKIAA